jgi:hypothetical protein
VLSDNVWTEESGELGGAISSRSETGRSSVEGLSPRLFCGPSVGSGGNSPLSLRRRAFFLGDADVRRVGLGDADDAGESTTKLGGATVVLAPWGNGDFGMDCEIGEAILRLLNIERSPATCEVVAALAISVLATLAELVSTHRAYAALRPATGVLCCASSSSSSRHPKALEAPPATAGLVAIVMPIFRSRFRLATSPSKTGKAAAVGTILCRSACKAGIAAIRASTACTAD